MVGPLREDAWGGGGGGARGTGSLFGEGARGTGSWGRAIRQTVSWGCH